MKAVVATAYGSPDVLQLQEVAKPVPKANEVLVKVRATVVSPAECAARKGDPFIVRFFTGLTRPKKAIPGSEVAGEIEAVGSGVRRFAVGDQIYAATGANFGASAEYVCFAETEAIALKPAALTHDEAAALCYSALTALPFLRDNGRIRAGQQVLINGASGAIGTVAVQLARHFGAHVTGVCSGANVEMVRALGAERVIDYTKEDFTATRETYDIIFDTVGKSSFSRSKNALKPGGVYLTTVPSAPIIPQMLWTARIGNKRAAIAFTGLRSASAKTKDLHAINELVEAGKLRAVIDRRYPFAEASEAHRYVDTGHAKGNVVLTP